MAEKEKETGATLADVLGGERTITAKIDDKDVTVRYNPNKFDGEWVSMAPKLSNAYEVYRTGLDRVNAQLIQGETTIHLDAETSKGLPVRFLRKVYQAVADDVYAGE